MKILIVEDNEDARNLLMKQLHAYSHEVTPAANGVEALEQALVQPPDIIVSDILMPKMDGFQLCHECKQNEQLKNTPFVFYTAAYTSDKDKKFALSLGANSFISKPAEPDILVQTLQEIFEKAKSGALAPSKVAPLEPSLFLSEYSKRIVAKLEDEVAQLELEITTRKQAEHDLNERVKELQCLYSIASVAERPGITLDELYQEVINLLPVGWQYPEITCGRIIIGDKEFKTENYTEPQWKQTSNIKVSGAEAGVIEVGYLEERPELDEGPFLREERQLIGAIAERLGKIIEQKQAEEERKQVVGNLLDAMQGTIQAIALTVETRDPYTAGHQRRVANLATSIATEMSLSEELIQGISMVGIVHDIGKIYVPAEILSKPGRLNEVEFSMIRMHCQAGCDIMKPVEFPWPIAQIILQHHERTDGSGYPSGLSGEDILLEARILAVADVVEAMASHRPYRPALGLDKALLEIVQNKGKLYDTKVVDACEQLFVEGRIKLES